VISKGDLELFNEIIEKTLFRPNFYSIYIFLIIQCVPIYFILFLHYYKTKEFLIVLKLPCLLISKHFPPIITNYLPLSFLISH